MIRARYIADGNTHTLTLRGHANYDEYGKDIVCAGCSSLVQALMAWLEYNEGNLEDASVDEVDGKYILSATGGDDVAAVFYMTSVGLELIAQNYPSNVQIDIIGIAD